jgi:hypothetical protein
VRFPLCPWLFQRFALIAPLKEDPMKAMIY